MINLSLGCGFYSRVRVRVRVVAIIFSPVQPHVADVNKNLVSVINLHLGRGSILTKVNA